eukprot:11224587-Lingulodinium_polyedra.AAC.1
MASPWPRATFQRPALPGPALAASLRRPAPPYHAGPCRCQDRPRPERSHSASLRHRATHIRLAPPGLTPGPAVQ